MKDPNYFYYKTPPEQFIKTHYPDIFEDAFLKFWSTMRSNVANVFVTTPHFNLLPALFFKYKLSVLFQPISPLSSIIQISSFGFWLFLKLGQKPMPALPPLALFSIIGFLINLTFC